MIHPFGLFFTKPPAPPMGTFSVSVITLAPSQIHAIYLFYSFEHCNELNYYYYYYYYYYFTFTDRSISSVSQYAVWFVISDGNSNELWNGLGKLFWLIFVLISEYSRIKKSGSNSKTIGIVFCCKISHIWSFLKWLKQWSLYTCKIPMTTEAANLKLRRVSRSEQYSSGGG